MSPSPTDTDLFLEINRFAERTAWLHGPMKAVASYGIVVFVLLIAAGWLHARRLETAKMPAVIWAGLGTLLAVGLNQPLVHFFHEARPYTGLSGILVLADRSTDPGFPSDHATMAGAVTVGLFLVDPLLGLGSLVFALSWRSPVCMSRLTILTTSWPAWPLVPSSRSLAISSSASSWRWWSRACQPLRFGPS